MDFGQDAGHAQHRDAAFGGSLSGDVKQRGFPDPGLAADDERGSALIDAVDQLIDQGNVLFSPCKTGDADRAARVRRLRGGASVFFAPLTIT